MYQRFIHNQIKPSGWLLEQLKIQANGLSGNLDKVWPDVCDSAWVGGDRDSWERVPYWLDGFIPLAYMLQDEDLIARADRYVREIMARQCADGWICPCAEEERSNYDIWALFLLCKVLTQYAEITGCKEAEQAVYRAMKNCYELMRDERLKLKGWGRFRWFEALISLKYLYDLRQEEWILALGKILRAQGADYTEFTEMWKVPLNVWKLETHIVNLAMMFKYEAVWCALYGTPYENKAEELWAIMAQYNGTATGIFTGDECLAGISNTHGVELCSVAELMYTCEMLYVYTGKDIWAQRLEKIAFNAWPATLSDDMWSHQYDQMVNQIACIKFPGKPFFRTNGDESHLFGLEPNFGCCTANHNQSWPKLVQHIFLRTQRGIHCALMLPAELHTVFKNTAVTIRTVTEYPFRHACTYVVEVEKPVAFELKIRIPKWAKNVAVNGEKAAVNGTSLCIRRTWEGRQEISVQFSDVPHFVKRPNGLRYAEYGALIFALPIETEYKMVEYERNNVERKFPYCDYELIPHSEWRYGFDSDMLTACELSGDGIPFSSKNPRIALTAVCSRVDWDYADGYTTVSAELPRNNISRSESKEVQLIPYGCAKLRMTEMPFTNKRKK